MAFGRLLYHASVGFFALPERLLRPLALRDVAGVDDDALDHGIVDQVLADGLEVAPDAALIPDPVLHGR